MKIFGLLVLLVLISGCASQVTQNNTTLSTPELSDDEINQAYESQYLTNMKPFIGGSNELFDLQVQLKGAGKINISEGNQVAEYFRIDFNVTNQANRDMVFLYEGNISEGNFPNVRKTPSDPKKPPIEVLAINETKDGYLLFKNYRPQNAVIELTITGGYRQFSSDSLNFRFKIAFQGETASSLQRVTLDFSETQTLQPDSFLMVKILTNDTYRYLLTSERNVSVEIWAPGTKVNTIQFSNTTINSTCSFKLQKGSVSKDCDIEKDHLLIIRRRTNAKAQDFGGTSITFQLFRVLPPADIPGTIKYTGQAAYDNILKDSEEVFAVL